jgi:hypothetical protein
LECNKEILNRLIKAIENSFNIKLDSSEEAMKQSDRIIWHVFDKGSFILVENRMSETFFFSAEASERAFFSVRFGDVLSELKTLERRMKEYNMKRKLTLE